MVQSLFEKAKALKQPTEIKGLIKKTKEKYEKQKEINKVKSQENKEIFEFTEKFYRLMEQLNLFNKDNDTYDLRIESKTNYGFNAKLYRNCGLSFAKLSDYLTVIEENLECIWIMNFQKFSQYAELKVVTKPLDLELLFENPEIKPWELYLGLSFDLVVNKNDNNRHQMFLISGSTGTGKTRMVSMMLLSWILSCSINEVELYISDIAKDEYCNFRYCSHVRYYCSELEQLYKMIKYLKIKLEKRKKIISQCREQGTATNIEEYNKISKIKMSYVYILIDEASIMMPSKGDKKEVIAMKEEILDSLCQFSKICRSYGIFPIIASQKFVRDEVPSLIKDMAAVRVAYRANGGKSSEAILGDNSAVGLLDRYALFSLDGGCTKNYLFSPKLTTERLNELLAPHIDKNRKKVDLDLAIKEYNQPPQPEGKVTPVRKRKLKLKTKENPYDVINISKIDDDIGVGSTDYININWEEDEYVDN